jgi:hypothetical protein
MYYSVWDLRLLQQSKCISKSSNFWCQVVLLVVTVVLEDITSIFRLEVEVVCFSETWLSTYKTTEYHKPEDHDHYVLLFFPHLNYSTHVMLTTHPHLVSRLSMSRSKTSSPPCASMACSRTALLYFYSL